MNLVTLMAFIEGYQEHLFDLKCIAVYQGYWAGYYSKAKKPMQLSAVLNRLLSEHRKASKKKKGKKPSPLTDVDVDAFLERERNFKSKLNK